MIEQADEGFKAAEAAWNALKADRTEHEQDWQDIARLIRTQRGGFSSADPALHRDDKPLDNSALIASANFASGLYGTLTNPTSRWFSFTTSDEDLAAWQPMKIWLDTVTKRVFRSLAPAVSPFYGQVIQAKADIAAFGNACFASTRAPGSREIVDEAISLAEVACDIDSFGRVREVARRFRISPVAAAERFGRDTLPPKLMEMVDKGARERVDFLHHVYPRPAGERGKRWVSVYASVIGKATVQRGGYDEMPIHYPRWEVDTGQTYGRGPGWIALPAARKAELMSQANLRAGQYAADPTLLAAGADDWDYGGRVVPGGIVYGGLDTRGNQMLRPLNTTFATGLSEAQQQQAVEAIRDAFHWTLMNLAGRSGMSATEVVERAEERLRLMAPHLGRVQEELLSPVVSRRFSILWRAGQLPPPPAEASGADLALDYTSAAAMAQRSAEGAATVRLIEDVGRLAEVDPSIADRFDADAALDVLQEARGAPARLVRSPDQARELREARAQAEAEAAQPQEMLEALTAGGAAAREIAGAAGALQQLETAR
ncbi:MAG: portal protein [Pseudomonadota bacterium]